MSLAATASPAACPSRPLTRRAALWLLPGLAACSTAVRPPGRDTVDGPALAAAVAGAHRQPAHRARDAARHPAETLAFFQVAPTHTVVEVAPGAGWYTDILAPYLRARGHLVLAADAPDDPRPAYREARARLAARLSADPATYGPVVLGTLGRETIDGLAPGTADRVLTFRNVHNWLENGTLDARLAAFHAALRPGGLLGVEEHRAPEGTSFHRAVATGYVPEGLVIARAEAAGFVLDGRSEVNANPRDTKDHPHGVWSLPPTLRGGAVGRDDFLAIGESDRMTLRLRKPG